MKFLRQLTAAVLAVAVIVALGMLWAHVSGGSRGLRHVPSHEALVRLEQIKAGANRINSGSGFQLAETPDLIRTCVIEALLAAVVITAGVVRKRHRRMRGPADRGQHGRQPGPRDSAAPAVRG